LVLLFALMVTVWSLSFVVVKVVTREVPALFAALLRAAGTALVLGPVALWHARKDPRARFQRADLFRLIAVALTGIAFNQVCFILGVSLTSVAHSSIVLSLAPMLVLLAAAIAGQERASVPQFAGMAVAMIGVGWLQLGVASGGGAASPVGDLFAFLSAASFAVYSVLNKQLTARYGGVLINAASFSIGAVCMAPFGLWAARGIDLTQLSARAWWGLAYLVLFTGVLGYSLFYYLLTHAPATKVALYNYIQPLEATLFAWMLLGEPVTLAVATGGLLVFAGVWLTVRSK
jgi:drug/metabolite transporter (DMT)-like permease